MLRLTVITCALLGLLVLFACGGGGGGGVISGSISITPTAAWPSVGQTVNLTATVTGYSNQTVIWTANGGSILPTGPNTATYTAPNVPGRYAVTARADADPSVAGVSVMDVGAIGVSVTPQQATIAVNLSVNLTAQVTGSGNQAVTWSASGGTITPTGVGTARYTAPSIQGSFIVTATSQADTNRRAVATITVTGAVGNNAVVQGRLINQDSRAGVSGISIVFLNAGGTVIAQYTSGTSGNFSAIVPTTAKRFHLVDTSIPAGYYKAYEYNTKRYTALSSICSAPLPALTAGGTVTLPTVVEIPPTTSPPPPPPNGCP